MNSSCFKKMIKFGSLAGFALIAMACAYAQEEPREFKISADMQHKIEEGLSQPLTRLTLDRDDSARTDKAFSEWVSGCMDLSTARKTENVARRKVMYNQELEVNVGKFLDEGGSVKALATTEPVRAFCELGQGKLEFRK
ncbi:MAG: hypothetical protein RDV41_08635, partial [Planctomycetota bacterium]|nr:hypothetical protein [Planctomycetota bacterium]